MKLNATMSVSGHVNVNGKYEVDVCMEDNKHFTIYKGDKEEEAQKVIDAVKNYKFIDADRATINTEHIAYACIYNSIPVHPKGAVYSAPCVRNGDIDD